MKKSVSLYAGGTNVSSRSSVDASLLISRAYTRAVRTPVGDCPMNEDGIIPWLLQSSTVWTALLVGLAPAAIANFKQRPVLQWYAYGFVCTLVAWPLITLPTIHALLLRPRAVSPEVRQRQRRAWIAELRRQSPEGVDRRRYAYEKIGRGESIELIREHANQHDDHAVAFRHRGVHLGYVPKRHRWVAAAMDEGRRLVAIVDKVKVGGIFRRRAKFVRVRIAVLDAN